MEFCKIEENELLEVNGGGVGSDMAWGAATGAVNGAGALAEFGPAGIIAGAYGALGGAITHGFRHLIGLD